MGEACSERKATGDEIKTMQNMVREAMRAGADYLVIGRPIQNAADPLAVAREIVADMARGFLVARTRGAARMPSA